MTKKNAGRLDIAYFGARELGADEVELLQSEGWVLDCPKCGGSFAVHTAVGSPLSGRGQLGGNCTSCQAKLLNLALFPSGTLANLVVIASRALERFRLLEGNAVIDGEEDESPNSSIH